MRQSVVLDESVKLIIVQFSFKNKKNVPLGIQQEHQETPKERRDRTVRRGRIAPTIQPTEKTDISIISGLENSGYELVTAFYKPRIDPKDDDIYHMVRFTFARKSNARPNENFKLRRTEIIREMERMCYLALWRVRVFENPYFVNNQPVPGNKAISINLELRKPRFHDDGAPFAEWQYDEKGNKIGLDPNPVKPMFKLHIENCELKLEGVI